MNSATSSAQPMPHSSVLTSAAEWKPWSDNPWAGRTAPASEVQLWVRLVESAAKAEGLASFLKEELPEIASEFAASWAAVLRRRQEWEKLGEFGRQPLDQIPFSLLANVLDRNAGVVVPVEAKSAQSWSVLALPLDKGGASGEVLILCGRTLDARTSLPVGMVAAHALGLAVGLVRKQEQAQGRIERLRSTLHIASQLAHAKETIPLLEMIAKEAARLLDADRSSIFIWDRESHEVVACPALGVEGGLLRLPDNAGIVGECLSTGQTIRVDDAYRDPRFNKQVDADSGYRTRNLLCVPLLDPDGERIGAFEAINKRQGPFSTEDEESLSELGTQAACAVENTREREQLVRRHQEITEQASQGVQIIGQSAQIVALRATVDRLAATDLPVLVLGESGTGKEVVAQALHYHGPRRNEPFVAVNCAALTETLLESELFGHEKGAFTDAHEARPGKFEIAAGGTLFLDEIGDMSQGGQAKLLRVLEQKVVTRVGGSQTIRTNVRVVAATNSNLAAAVRDRRFREDLYYRLTVVGLELPPLRDRPEDIIPLAEHFLDRFAKQAGRRKLTLAAEAKRRLQGHGWPGNIRELRNLMERVAFLGPHDRIEADDLAFILSPARETTSAGSTDLGLSEATARFQQDYIRRMIKRVQGNMSQAAELMGLHRSNLYRKMRHLNMSEAEDEKEI